jgi:hypothetical protein
MNFVKFILISAKNKPEKKQLLCPAGRSLLQCLTSLF